MKIQLPRDDIKSISSVNVLCYPEAFTISISCYLEIAKGSIHSVSLPFVFGVSKRMFSSEGWIYCI